MGSIGFTELLLIFLVIMLLFGAKKLPELAQGLGQAMREFRKAAREVEDIGKLDSGIESDKDQYPDSDHTQPK